MVSAMKREVTDPNILAQLNGSTPTQSSFLDKAAGMADKFNNLIEGAHLPEVGAGFLQGAGDVGASLGNLIARPFGHPIPHPNFQKYFGNSLGSKIAFGAGELGSQIPLMASGAATIGRLTNIGSKAGLSGRVAQGTVSGGLLGENEEGGRLGGIVTGGVLPIASSTVKGIAKMGSNKISDNVLKALRSTEKEYKQKFKSIFKEADRSGINRGLKRVEHDSHILARGGDKDYIHALQEYNYNPTLSNAHSAQSDLGKYIANIGRPKNSLERHAKNEAKYVQKTLKENMIEHMHSKGRVDLALKYLDAKEGYKNELLPYLKSKPIKALQEGEIRKKNFANAIAKDEKFMSKIGQYRHPEISRRETMSKVLNSKAGQYGIGTALGSAGLYGLARLFK